MTSFQLQKPKISDGAVGQQAIKTHPLYPGYLLRSYKKSHLSRKGVKAIPHPFSILPGWENEECEDQQIMLNSPVVKNSVCSQNKPHTGMEPIGWYKLCRGSNESD